MRNKDYDILAGLCLVLGGFNLGAVVALIFICP